MTALIVHSSYIVDGLLELAWLVLKTVVDLCALHNADFNALIEGDLFEKWPIYSTLTIHVYMLYIHL